MDGIDVSGVNFYPGTDLPVRICGYDKCRKHVPQARARNKALYCSPDHQVKQAKKRSNRKASSKNQIKEAQRRLEVPPNQVRGSLYLQMQETPWPQMIEKGDVTLAVVAEKFSTTVADVSRTMEAFRFDWAQERAIEDWEPSWRVKALVPVDKMARIRELGLSGQDDTDEFNDLLNYLTHAFMLFSRWYFRLEGERPIVEAFHVQWHRAIIYAFATGGKQLIVTPPRHGKSETMIRFCLWLICINPNIRIMWVAASKDVAKIMIGAVKSYLTEHEDLRKDVLGPNGHWKPPRNSGKPWLAHEIKVDQCTWIGAKSSTMIALGRTSKILSRDVDQLIVDDLEDFDTTRDADQREYSRNKFAEIGTRKEEKTAWVDICSRQHPADLVEHLSSGGSHKKFSQGWKVLTHTAHFQCELDVELPDGHDDNGCVLFPKIRSYRWLLEKKEEMDDLGIAGAYEMRYLQEPIPEGALIFHLDTIRAECFDHSRGLGIESLPKMTLIAGLDPSPRKTQAAFLWGYNELGMWMIDAELQEAGGFEAARDVMRRWQRQYHNVHWVYEDNSQQVEFFRGAEFAVLRNEGIFVEPHTTGKNKQDKSLGLTSMAPKYHTGFINLPYGTPEAKKLTNELVRQLGLWTSDGEQGGRNRKTDLRMASWFPFPKIQLALRDPISGEIDYEYEQSYPGVVGFDEMPWQTAYPGM